MRYEADADGTLANGKVFFDMNDAPGDSRAISMFQLQRTLGAIAEGKRLGTIVAPKHPHNFAWGDEDGKTLYLCARSGLYRMRLNIAGIRAVTGIKPSGGVIQEWLSLCLFETPPEFGLRR